MALRGSQPSGEGWETQKIKIFREEVTSGPILRMSYDPFFLQLPLPQWRNNTGINVERGWALCSTVQSKSMHLPIIKLCISRVLSGTRNKFVYPSLVYFLILLICVIIQSLWNSAGSKKCQARNLFIVLLFLLSHMNGFSIIKMGHEGFSAFCTNFCRFLPPQLMVWTVTIRLLLIIWYL